MEKYKKMYLLHAEHKGKGKLGGKNVLAAEIYL
jgi:hypothetical protein